MTTCDRSPMPSSSLRLSHSLEDKLRSGGHNKGKIASTFSTCSDPAKVWLTRPWRPKQYFKSKPIKALIHWMIGHLWSTLAHRWIFQDKWKELKKQNFLLVKGFQFYITALCTREKTIWMLLESNPGCRANTRSPYPLLQCLLGWWSFSVSLQ